MEFKCCICGGTFEGYGNNPWPVVKDEDAECCDRCNANRVVPARIKLMSEKAYGTEQSEQRKRL